MERKSLDCKGYSCPKPLIQLAKMVRSSSPGDEIEVKATDPSFTLDIKAWTEKTGNTLIQIDEDGDVLTALIRLV